MADAAESVPASLASPDVLELVFHPQLERRNGPMATAAPRVPSRLELINYCPRAVANTTYPVAMGQWAGIFNAAEDATAMALPGWAMFPVVFADRYQNKVMVATYAAVIANVRINDGSGAEDNGSFLHSPPKFESVTLVSGVSVQVDVSYISRGASLRDSMLSILGALGAANVPSGHYLYLFPLVSSQQYEQRRRELGGIDGKVAWSFGGASLGHAIFMAARRGFPCIYTGYMSNLGIGRGGSPLTLGSVDNEDIAEINAARREKGITKDKYRPLPWSDKLRPSGAFQPTYAGSLWIETVQDVIFKTMLALACNQVIVIPASTQYNMDMASVARSLIMSQNIQNMVEKKAVIIPSDSQLGFLDLPKNTGAEVFARLRATEIRTTSYLFSGMDFVRTGAQVLISKSATDSALWSVLVAWATGSSWTVNDEAATLAIASYKRALLPLAQKRSAGPLAPEEYKNQNVKASIVAKRAKRYQSYLRMKHALIPHLKAVMGANMENANEFYQHLARDVVQQTAQGAGAEAAGGSAPPGQQATAAGVSQVIDENVAPGTQANPIDVDDDEVVPGVQATPSGRYDPGGSWGQYGASMGQFGVDEEEGEAGGAVMDALREARGHPSVAFAPGPCSALCHRFIQAANILERRGTIQHGTASALGDLFNRVKSAVVDTAKEHAKAFGAAALKRAVAAVAPKAAPKRKPAAKRASKGRASGSASSIRGANRNVKARAMKSALGNLSSARAKKKFAAPRATAMHQLLHALDRNVYATMVPDSYLGKQHAQDVQDGIPYSNWKQQRDFESTPAGPAQVAAARNLQGRFPAERTRALATRNQYVAAGERENAQRLAALAARRAGGRAPQ